MANPRDKKGHETPSDPKRNDLSCSELEELTYDVETRSTKVSSWDTSIELLSPNDEVMENLLCGLQKQHEKQSEYSIKLRDLLSKATKEIKELKELVIEKERLLVKSDNKIRKLVLERRLLVVEKVEELNREVSAGKMEDMNMIVVTQNQSGSAVDDLDRILSILTVKPSRNDPTSSDKEAADKDTQKQSGSAVDDLDRSLTILAEKPSGNDETTFK